MHEGLGALVSGGGALPSTFLGQARVLLVALFPAVSLPWNLDGWLQAVQWNSLLLT